MCVCVREENNRGWGREREKERDYVFECVQDESSLKWKIYCLSTT